MNIGKYWKTILNSVQEGVIIIDSSGRLVAANHAATLMTGYTEDELIGKSCRILNCTGCKIKGTGAGKDWCGLFSRKIMSEKKCLISNRHNRYIQIIKRASVLYDDDGRIVGAVETLKDISESINCKNELRSLKKMYHLDDGFHGIIGRTSIMQTMFEIIKDVAVSDTPVMILGESGTGKELVAKAIHESGSRHDGPFIEVNCAALNENLLEDELFGHVKGAFTGADSCRIGRFEAAHKGTIFLDEIGDAPMSIQVKLLRVLENKKIQRVGESRSIPVDVRIITATNRNLEKMMADNEFREDLFFRINVFPIVCPSLEKRKEDIPLIIQHFVNINSKKTGKNILGFSPEAMQLMMKYPWPGNIRELRNAVEYAFVLSHQNIIGPEHLQEKITKQNIHDVDRKIFVSSSTSFDSGRQKLIQTLKETGGNQSKAAAILGISRVTVWKHIKKFNIDFKSEIKNHI